MAARVSPDPWTLACARAPAAPAAAAIAAASLTSGFRGSGTAIFVLGVTVGLLAWTTRRARRAIPALALGAWTAFAGLAGARAIATVARSRADASEWARLAAAGEPLRLTATLRIETVRASGDNRWSVRGTLSGCGRPCDGAEARLVWSDPSPPGPGERWIVHGELAPEPLRVAPGSRYPPAGLGPGARGGFLAEPRVLDRGPPSRGTAAAIGTWIRARLEARYGESLAPLAVALVLGDRREIDPALSDAFARTGTLHLLAVSGLHVGFLAALLALGLSLTGCSPAARAAWTVPILAGYATLVGTGPSVVRAAIMAALALWGRAGERQVSHWQWWGAAAGGMLAWRPADVFDLGFALSFAAVAGLLSLAGPLTALARGTERATLRWVWTGLVATTAASAGTLVVQSASFGWIAPVGFLANPVAVPLCGAALPLLWIGLALDALMPEALAGPVASAAAVALAGLVLVVAIAGRATGPWVPGPGGWAATAVVGLAAAFLVGRRRPGAGALVAAAAISLALAARPPRAPAWEITWLDVGQGDAIAIRFPDGASWLVDAGPGWERSDEGRRTVVPWLRRQGIARLEWLITTHPDLDHIGGAGSVLAGVEVRRWGSGGPVATTAAYLDLVSGAAGTPRAAPLRAGRRLEQGGVAIDVLHPGERWLPSDPYASRVPPNEASAVLLLGAGPCRALLTGDLGTPAEAALVAALGDSLRADLLHVGHHGSRHSSSGPFLARVRPRFAVVSVGAGNRYGHPHADALRRLAAIGAEVHRTDRVGTITARCTPAGWRLRSEHSYLP